MRKAFSDTNVAIDSPIAGDTPSWIGELYGIEAKIRGQLTQMRQHVRQAGAGPLLRDLRRWLIYTIK